MRRFLTEAKSGDVADGLRTHVVSAVYYHCAPGEEYEIHNRQPFAHDIDCHNRCGCAGWKRAWSSEAANHRHATADNCADDCFAGRACVEAFPAQVTVSFNDEIAPTGVGKGYAAFRSVSEAHISRGRDESDRSWLETRPLIQMQRHPYSGRRCVTVLPTMMTSTMIIAIVIIMDPCGSTRFASRGVLRG